MQQFPYLENVLKLVQALVLELCVSIKRRFHKLFRMDKEKNCKTVFLVFKKNQFDFYKILIKIAD